MKKLSAKTVDQTQLQVEEMVVPGLERFVKAIKDNLWNQIKRESIAPSTIKNAENLEKKFNDWGSHDPGSESKDNSGNHLYMDYLLHHRVGLATEIVRSMANGQQLSEQRKKILKNSIDYIEQRL